MITIQGYTGKSRVLESMLKEDLDKGDVWLVDTVGIPALYRGYESKGQLYGTVFTGFDFKNLGTIEDRLKEGILMDELGEAKKVYLSMNAPQDAINTLHEIESRIGIELVVTIQTSKGVLEDRVLVSEMPMIKD